MSPFPTLPAGRVYYASTRPKVEIHAFRQEFVGELLEGKVEPYKPYH
jgi:hypothetical protein